MDQFITNYISKAHPLCTVECLMNAFLSLRVVLVLPEGIKDIVSLLEKFSGTKAIFWDEQLTGPIGLVAEYSFLKKLDVVKMFQLKPGCLPSISVKNILFITRPEVELMDCIADNLHSEESQGHSASKEYQLIFVSRRSAVCEQRLKDKGLYGTLTSIDELPVDFFPLDSDVISMELDNVFKINPDIPDERELREWLKDNQ
ncbi:hypothetical protein DAPPUDRAFT_113272 [Daphnia pulex]|uniref:Uncharacterized protein n=1 Tax=Daphnia pulex TaxID=6669 RepID=E9HEJ5_DAPPU|nr:hypothetical protein DAPPUDRAFT_113272 [Daphnia pulex]|eukprot:EFX69866.1 hypothetical protein DAPPUDRAFT_113272 [Daphnia pulex]